MLLLREVLYALQHSGVRIIEDYVKRVRGEVGEIAFCKRFQCRREVTCHAVNLGKFIGLPLIATRKGIAHNAQHACVTASASTTSSWIL